MWLPVCTSALWRQPHHHLPLQALHTAAADCPLHARAPRGDNYAGSDEGNSDHGSGESSQEQWWPNTALSLHSLSATPFFLPVLPYHMNQLAKKPSLPAVALASAVLAELVHCCFSRDFALTSMTTLLPGCGRHIPELMILTTAHFHTHNSLQGLGQRETEREIPYVLVSCSKRDTRAHPTSPKGSCMMS